MDLILGPFADEELADLPVQLLDLYEEMLSENDQDLYRWVSDQEPVPKAYEPLLAMLTSRFGNKRAAFAATGLRSTPEKLADMQILNDLIEAGKLRFVSNLPTPPPE